MRAGQRGNPNRRRYEEDPEKCGPPSRTIRNVPPIRIAASGSSTIAALSTEVTMSPRRAVMMSNQASQTSSTPVVNATSVSKRWCRKPGSGDHERQQQNVKAHPGDPPMLGSVIGRQRRREVGDPRDQHDRRSQRQPRPDTPDLQRAPGSGHLHHRRFIYLSERTSCCSNRGVTGNRARDPSRALSYLSLARDPM